MAFSEQNKQISLFISFNFRARNSHITQIATYCANEFSQYDITKIPVTLNTEVGNKSSMKDLPWC